MTTAAPPPNPPLASPPSEHHIKPQPQPQPPVPIQQQPEQPHKQDQQQPQQQQQQQQHQQPQRQQQLLVLQPQPQQPHHHQLAPSRQHHSPAPAPPLQPVTPNALRHPKSPFPLPTTPATVNNASPPSKRDLKSWWKGFKLQSRNHDTPEQRPPGIFGVPLRDSVKYANVAISLIDENGKSYIYGYVPIVVAKCGVFLKERATGIEGIFRLSGSEKRIKELKIAFDSPDRYGKGLSWNGYTVHDAANVLRRYLNDLPEPVVPLDFYDRFREPLRYAVQPSGSDTDGPQFVSDFDMSRAIGQYQHLITELPPLNRQLLLYILDLLAVFAAKSDVNRMNSQNLAAIFQPGILSHPHHAMAPEEYRLNQTVLIFLIENQDHFLIGMQGTAADEKTVQEVQRGTPPVTPAVGLDAATAVGVSRTASNASAGAESVARDGKIRRNRSTSSRRSNNNSVHHITHNATPRSSSPALVTTPTNVSGASGGLARSNTLPARSPGLGPGRFAKTGSPVSPLTPIGHHSASHATPTVEPVAEAASPTDDAPSPNPFAGTVPRNATPSPTPGLGLGLSPPPPGSPLALAATKDGATGTPAKERRFQLFQRSPASDGELRPQPNKLKKKRMPSSTNPSAQSSTASLPPATGSLASPSHERTVDPFDEHHSASTLASVPASVPEAVPAPALAAAHLSSGYTSDDQAAHHHTPSASAADVGSDSTPRASQAPSAVNTATPSTPAAVASADAMLRPHRRSPSTSLHSSFNEGSDLDQVDEIITGTVPDHADQPEKAKKRLWRLSRRRDDQVFNQASMASVFGQQPSTSNLSTASTPPQLASSVGSNAHATLSTSSIGSGGLAAVDMGAISLTGASGSSDPTLATTEPHTSRDSGASGGSSRDSKDGKDELNKGKLTGWLKSKYREAKENAEQRRNKSPSPSDKPATTGLVPGPVRGKSLDLSRAADEERKSS